MHNAERLYRNACKKPETKEYRAVQKGIFLRARKHFDKLLVKKKRAYCNGLLMKIDKVCNKNPTEFWKYIKNLGPGKKQEIPWEVLVDGKTVTDKPGVLEHWRNTFHDLFQDNDGHDFDNLFKENELKGCAEASETDKNDELDYINGEITVNEVERAVKDSKTKKAVRIDRVSNELLKHPVVIKLLCNLFNRCMQGCIVPSNWKTAIIHPIPKESGRLIDPLKYHGISLQSCVYKIFSSILNKRLAEFIESRELSADEQNGFRKGRSCEDHVYVLSTLIRRQFSIKKPLFAMFIDFKKAFDFTDRELLYCKLIKWVFMDMSLR